MSDPGTIAITVSYDGAPFAGFARQPAVETVQGRLEGALRTVLHRDVEIVGAGRTDAGVHALGQVLSFAATGDEPDSHTLMRSLNALAGPDIVATEVRRAPAGFSARFDAVSREYRYRIVPGPVPPVFLARYAWWVRPTLDLGTMREAAAALVGEHDFRSFCVTASAQGKSTTRVLELVSIGPQTVLGEHCIEIRVVGNAFLHSMVRVIAGSLVEIGEGRQAPGWMAEVLAARNRSAVGQTAPPEGLTLWHVDYAQECWL